MVEPQKIRSSDAPLSPFCVAKGGIGMVKLGAYSHIGLVVEDVEKTAGQYEKIFGMGPWTIATYDLPDITYRGRKTKAVVKAGIAYVGDTFIELVEVLEGETPHTEFFSAKGAGVQHVAFPVEDMEATMLELRVHGIEPIMEYKFRIEGEKSVASHRDPAKRRPLDVHEIYLNSDEVIGGPVIQLMQLTEVED